MIQNWSIYVISVAQVRAARGLLGWSQTHLGEAAGLSLPTVKRYETGKGANVSTDARAAIHTALEAAGVEFIAENGGGPGVRLRNRRAPQEGTRPEDLNASNDD